MNKANLNFDDILESRIGFGLYQMQCVIVLALIDFVDGIDLIYMSLALPVIKKEMNLEFYQIEQLSGIFYFGMIFGCILTGNLADKYGRRNCLLIASIFFYMVESINAILLARFMYGFCFGFSLPLTTSVVTEINPLLFRGKMLILLSLFVTLGKIFGCYIAFIFLDENLQSGNWQLMISTACVFSLITFIGTLAWVEESPRFLLAKGQIEKALLVINRIIVKNDYQNQHLSQTEIDGLIQTYDFSNRKNDQNDDDNVDIQSTFLNNFKKLFSKEYYAITIKLWIMWFLVNFISYGHLNFIPFVIEEQQKGISTILVMILGEVPASLMSCVFIDREGYGRRFSISLFFILQSVFFLVSYIDLNHLSYVLFLQRFCIKNAFGLMYPYTSESYPTLFRTIGFGYSSAFGRLGASLMPFIIFPIFEIDRQAPFLALSIAALLSGITAYTFNYDTQGHSIQQIEDSKIALSEHVQKKDYIQLTENDNNEQNLKNQ